MRYCPSLIAHCLQVVVGPIGDWPAPHKVLLIVAWSDVGRCCYIQAGAMGYSKPYEWAHLSEVPFRALNKPLSQASVAVITFAAPIELDKGDQGPGAPMDPAAAFHKIYSAPSNGAPELGISHLHYDRAHVRAADEGAIPRALEG